MAGWKGIAASVLGKNHERLGLGCDDAHALAITDDGLAVLVAADGAGSHSGTSALGAWHACRSILNGVEDMTAREIDEADEGELEELMRWLFREARDQLAAEAAALDLPLAKLSTTLVAALLGHRRGVVAQLGDGVVVVRDAESTRWVIPEDEFEYPNWTTFLVLDSDLATMRVLVVDDVDAVALSTDGLEYKICQLHDRTPFEPFFHGLWRQLAEKEPTDQRLAAQLSGIPDDQTGDDLTLVSVVRVPDNRPRVTVSLEPPHQEDPEAIPGEDAEDDLAPVTESDDGVE